MLGSPNSINTIELLSSGNKKFGQVTSLINLSAVLTLSHSFTMKNVEIKAYVRNLKHLLEAAKLLGEKEAEIIKQNDVFFNVNQGRLKLRKFEVICL